MLKLEDGVRIAQRSLGLACLSLGIPLLPILAIAPLYNLVFYTAFI